MVDEKEPTMDEKSGPLKAATGGTDEPDSGFKYYLVGVRVSTGGIPADMDQKVFQHADPQTRAMYGVAFVGAIVSGAAMPLMTIVFGSFTTKFSDFSVGAISPAAFKTE
ncbi:MAG: hypothetical protein L6R42_010529, partial [Xanthoria sp. 1 TBL-2021]